MFLALRQVSIQLLSHRESQRVPFWPQESGALLRARCDLHLEQKAAKPVTDVAVHYPVGDQLCSEQVELISVLGRVSPNETRCQTKPLAWSIRTLHLIFLGCGKPARRMESCDEHISAAEKMGDGSERPQGAVGAPEMEHPSPAVGEGPLAERSWTC